MKLAQKTKSEKDLGRPFDYEWAYNSVLNNLTDMGPSETIGMAYTDLAGDGRTKSFAEIRQKALDIMKENAIFKVQPETTQLELLNAFDRALGIRSNAQVRREIGDIRNKLKQRKV